MTYALKRPKKFFKNFACQYALNNWPRAKVLYSLNGHNSKTLHAFQLIFSSNLEILSFLIIVNFSCRRINRFTMSVALTITPLPQIRDVLLASEI